MKLKLTGAILAFILLVAGAVSFGAIIVSKDIPSGGDITTSPNIGVFTDSACTIPATSINWGTIAAGTSTTQTVYVKNTGTGSIVLSMSTSGWNPTSAATYITVSMNQVGTSLVAGASIQTIITLNVSPTITGITSFSNTITISGTG